MKKTFNVHVPVLLQEAVEALVHNPEGIYVDATFGRGSHSEAILNRLNDKGRLFAFDKDPEAIAYAKQKFSNDSRFHIFHRSFDAIANTFENLQLINQIDGILFDLGVSSPQLENSNRGFSFILDGPLDMRMDPTKGMSAGEWLQTVDDKTLADILWQFGEERYSRRIARAIVSSREKSPLTSTLQLADIIKRAAPKSKKEVKHPATRSFQAIRIFINQELTELELALEGALNSLKPAGRLAVISFHSLEDRIVKQFMRNGEKGPNIPRGLPIKDHTFKAKLILRKPIKPSEQEIDQNPRSRSAILRIAEKQS